jgi:hypothetical protein
MAKLSKSKLNNGVMAWRYYLGSSGFAPYRVEEKFYRKAMWYVDKISDVSGMSKNDIQTALMEEAEKRGPIKPIPGKDY